MSEVDPVHDPKRLEILGALALRDPDVAAVLDDLAERTAKTLGLPIALVSLVLDDVQHFAGAYGLEGWLAEVGGTPVEWSFCAHVVRDDQPLLVSDAHGDGRFANNPLVTIDGVTSYYGVPIRVDDQVMGSLCVIGTEVRDPAPETIEVLNGFANEAAAALRGSVRRQP